MKTAQVIAELQRLDPTGELEVVIAVRTYNKAHPAAYIKPFCADKVWDEIRLSASLPDNMHVVTRKAA